MGSQSVRKLETLPPCGHPAPCGCSYGGPCCTRCTLPACVLDDPRRAAREYLAKANGRAEEARRLRRLGLAKADIAHAVGVSGRTVERYLQRSTR